MLSEIIPNLFVGNKNTAKFALNQFDLIINCTKNLPDSLPSSDVSEQKNGIVLRIPIDDLPEYSNILYDCLPNITEEIHKNILNDKKVLVHCNMGMSRSCTVIAAYLLRYTELKSIEQTVNFIKQKHREAFFIDVRFYSVLNDFKNNLCNN